MRVLVIIIVTIFLASCTTYTRHEYSAPTTKLKAATVIVTMAGGYNEEELIWGMPYSMQFWVRAPLNQDLSKVRIEDIKLTGKTTNNELSLANTSSNKIRILKDKPELNQTVASSPVPTENFNYESYILEYTTYVYFGDMKTPLKEKVKTDLKINTSKERHLDAFDEVMSI